MRGKIISAIFQLLTLSAVCNEVESDVCIGEVEQLYRKYLSDRKYVVNNLHEVMHKRQTVLYLRAMARCRFIHIVLRIIHFSFLPVHLNC